MVANKTGKAPPVIDADDLCSSPKAVLISLCSALGINFYDELLHWNTGSQSYDGIWGDYWYRSVNKSSGFSSPKDKDEELSFSTAQIINAAEPYFQTLNEYKITF